MSVFSEYKKEIMEAAHDERIRLALSRAIASYRSNRNTALEKFPHTIKLAEGVREVKEQAIGKMEELARQACEAIESNKGKAYIAKTSAEALEIVDKLVGTGKLIVKGKSMTGEEIGLREHLEERGNEVYETDLGEFIIQKLNSRPMHILSPAIHVPKEDVAKLFSKITGEQLPPVIGFPAPVTLDDHQWRPFHVLIGSEPITALGALTPPTDGCAFTRGAGIEHPVVIVAAKWTLHMVESAYITIQSLVVKI